jgi:hypothetical protein
MPKLVNGRTLTPTHPLLWVIYSLSFSRPLSFVVPTRQMISLSNQSRVSLRRPVRNGGLFQLIQNMCAGPHALMADPKRPKSANPTLLPTLVIGLKKRVFSTRIQ